MKKISIAVASGLPLAQINAHAFEAVANVEGVAPVTEQAPFTYVVAYECDGQPFSTRPSCNPGNQLRVNVAVTPR